MATHNPYHNPSLPDMPHSNQKLLVETATAYVQKDSRGIDNWYVCDRQRQIGPLEEAWMIVHRVIDGNGNDVGRSANVYLRGAHIATLFYGPSRSFGQKRRLKNIQYHQ